VVKNRLFTAIIIGFISFQVACTQVGATRRLSPGMTPAQVRAAMGNPSQSQFVNQKMVWKYTLHQPWKGFIPYYLVFSKETGNLESWEANEAEYYRQQSLWMAAFPPTQYLNVNGTIDHNVDVRVQGF